MRVSRTMNPNTKAKISQKLSGRKKPDATRRRISEGMKRYWATIPNEEEKK